jgi:hypothetical protein
MIGDLNSTCASLHLLTSLGPTVHDSVLSRSSASARFPDGVDPITAPSGFVSFGWSSCSNHCSTEMALRPHLTPTLLLVICWDLTYLNILTPLLAPDLA